MKILFLHDNFPAQFGPIGVYLANKGWDVAFGTQREGAKSPLIKTFNYKPHREITKGVHPYAATFEKAAISGQAAARACLELKKGGYAPDVMVAHSGWGPGMYLKDVWPDARYVGYFEWYYQPVGPDVAFMKDEGERNEDELLRTRGRNAPILTDLAACDFGLCPTEYQKSQFPPTLADKLTVIHDGIDVDTYAPSPGAKLVLPGLDLSGADEIITYVARGMEPYRGFPQFMAAAAEVMARRPNAHVVVVGEDRVAYGRKLPEGESWKQRMLAQHNFDEKRLHFTGLIPRDQYLKVLQASSVHLYLTVPFVLSWSMMEAMSAGCLLVASDTDPVRELIENGKNGVLVDFYNVQAIARAIIRTLEDPAKYAPLRAAARQTIIDHYGAQDIYARKEKMFAGDAA
ncbi:MAG TPA: glycosyltransferase family 4 protein [Parvularculaceae bacterium]|nr:glycosyltransferase family 4 protein [Parvularculaceae bacterium]